MGHERKYNSWKSRKVNKILTVKKYDKEGYPAHNLVKRESLGRNYGFYTSESLEHTDKKLSKGEELYQIHEF